MSDSMTPEPTVLFPEVVDSTILSCIDECETKAYLQFMRRFAKSATPIALHAGGAFAHGVESVRRNLYVHGMTVEEALIDGFKQLALYWGPDDIPPDHKDPRCFLNVLAALFDYFLVEYPPDKDIWKPYVGSSGKPAIEYTFALPMEVNHPITGQPLIYGGRADMIATNGAILAVVDEKTTTSLGNTWAAQWALRGQFIGYVYALQCAGMDCDTALIRGVAIQKTQIKHLQAYESYSEQKVERWWKDCHVKLRHIIEKYEQYLDTKDEDTFTHSWGTACSNYGGCGMKEICDSDTPSDWYGNFITRTWNPLQKNPVAEREIRIAA